MTKTDLAIKIAHETGLEQTQVRRIIQMVLDGLIECIASEGGIELRNFGVFKVRTRRPKAARNPKTGEKVMVPERKAVVFKPGKVMEERISGQKVVGDQTHPTHAPQATGEKIHPAGSQ